MYYGETHLLTTQVKFYDSGTPTRPGEDIMLRFACNKNRELLTPLDVAPFSELPMLARADGICSPTTLRRPPLLLG